MKIALIWLGASLAVAAERSPNPSLLALPDGSWSLLPNSQMASGGDTTIPCCGDGHGCHLSGILAYSGATFDASRGRIIVWGGGHNDYFGNQIMLFDLDTLRWSLETQPSSMCDYPVEPGYTLLDGRPVSHHSYDHIQYIGPLDSFFSFAGSSADEIPYNGGSSWGDLWTYAFNTRSWTDHTAQMTGNDDYYLNASLGDSGEYDAVTHSWYHLSAGGIWRYDLASKVWEQRLETGPAGIERTSITDGQRRIWTYGGGYGGGSTWSYYDIAANNFVIVSTASAPGPRNSAGLAYDAANDHVVLYGGGEDNSVWNYDLTDGIWSAYARPNAPPAARTFQRFGYDPINHVFYLVPNIDEVWIWKNTLGSSLDLTFRDGFEN